MVGGVVDSSSDRKLHFSSVKAFPLLLCLGLVWVRFSRAFMPNYIYFQPQTVLAMVMHRLGCRKSERGKSSIQETFLGSQEVDKKNRQRCCIT